MYANGGPAASIWFFIGVAGFVTILNMSLAEIASSLPVRKTTQALPSPLKLLSLSLRLSLYQLSVYLSQYQLSLYCMIFHCGGEASLPLPPLPPFLQTAGSLYFWAAYLSPPKWRAFISFATVRMRHVTNSAQGSGVVASWE